MIKKLLFSLAIIVAAGSTAILGTQALVSDSAVLGASTYSTETADLKIKTDGPDFADSANGFSNIKLNPGESVTHTIYLQNNSNIALTLSGKATDVNGSISPDKVSIKFVVHNSSPIVTTSNSSLTTWQGTDGKNLGSGFNLPGHSSQQYDMVVSLASTAVDGNFNYGFVFTGENVPNVSP